MNQKITITSILWLLHSVAFAQKDKVVIWNTFQFPIKLTEKWRLQNDISYRTLGISVSAYQYTFRTGLRYYFKNNLSSTIGVAEFNTRTAFENKTNEFAKELRLWQELAHEPNLSSSLKILNRFRLEQRHFYKTSSKKSFNALRLRYRFGISNTFSKKWTLTLVDEYMGQVIKNDYSFQQNRFGISLSHNLSSTTQIQLGYIWSYLKVESIHFTTFTIQKMLRLNGKNDN